MPKQLPRYHSYLLRCWEEDGVVTSWRFMLENPHNGERRGFDSYAALLAFLESELAEGATPAKEREAGTRRDGNHERGQTDS